MESSINKRRKRKNKSWYLSNSEHSDVDEATGAEVDFSTPLPSFSTTSFPSNYSPEVSRTPVSSAPEMASMYRDNNRPIRMKRSDLNSMPRSSSLCESEVARSSEFRRFRSQEPLDSVKSLSNIQRTNQRKGVENRIIHGSLPHVHYMAKNAPTLQPFIKSRVNKDSFAYESSHIIEPANSQRISSACESFSGCEGYKNEDVEISSLNEPTVAGKSENCLLHCESKESSQIPLCETLYKNTASKESCHWVTIFGFPEGYSELALRVFSSDGVVQEIRTPKHHPYNYIHVRYENRMQAAKVIRKQWVKIAPSLMVGAIECTDPSVIAGSE